jgi:hypothetical protein
MPQRWPTNTDRSSHRPVRQTAAPGSPAQMRKPAAVANRMSRIPHSRGKASTQSQPTDVIATDDERRLA